MPQDWYLVTIQALQDLWIGFLYAVPKLIGATLIFLVGWVVSGWVGWVVAKALNWLKFNQLFAKGQWDEALAKAGIKPDISEFIGQVCRWILVITFMLSAVEILGLSQFSLFLSDVVAWLPNVITAVLIMVVTVVVAEIVEKVVVAAVAKAKIRATHTVALLVRWPIYTFALLAILIQLGIAPSLIEILFTGIVATLVIALGLALGLGGKDLAKEIMEDLYHKVKNE